MRSLKPFIQLANKAGRGVHVVTNRTNLKNSCWELRKDTRQANRNFNGSHEGRNHQSYRSSPVDQQFGNWPSSETIDKAGSSMLNRTSEYNSTSRADCTHYTPTSMADRRYYRTWNDYGECIQFMKPTLRMQEFKRPPVRKRVLPFKLQADEEPKLKKETYYNCNGLDFGILSFGP
ncbi:uncharacterized protein LOC127565628 [Drosophila albomicans]|uniref:Uncharacterized protein LOC127565628 n=1 Tax=Drosophila albomicans TaxID=7291 RepID=A0A9C6SS87_DROAB|nr:uncharacterized protein LOC127565628 [Drosophila albomicans]